MSFDPNALPVPDLGLRCLSCGYNLAGRPEHRCPECGRKFSVEEHLPNGDFPVVIYNGREIRPTRAVVEIMNRANIPYMEKLGHGAAMFGVDGPMRDQIRLAVLRSEYFRAISLLRRFDRGGEMPDAPGPAPPEWDCPACGESNPGNFETCWNCAEQNPVEP